MSVFELLYLHAGAARPCGGSVSLLQTGPCGGSNQPLLDLPGAQTSAGSPGSALQDTTQVNITGSATHLKHNLYGRLGVRTED